VRLNKRRGRREGREGREFIRRFRRFTQIENLIFGLNTSRSHLHKLAAQLFIVLVFICVNLRNLRIKILLQFLLVSKLIKSEFIRRFRRFRRFTQIENLIFVLSSYSTRHIHIFTSRPHDFILMVFICVNLRNLRIKILLQFLLVSKLIKSEFIRRFRRFTQIENLIFVLSSYSTRHIRIFTSWAHDFILMVFICINLRIKILLQFLQISAD